MRNGTSTAVVEYDCLSAAGLDVDSSWETLAADGSGIREIDRYDPDSESLPGVPSIRYGGQIPITFDDLAGSPARFSKWAEPSYHAVKLLVDRVLGKIDFDASQHDPQRFAVIGATALTSQLSRDILHRTGKADSKFILNQCHNIPLSVAASQHGLKGPSFSIGSACASSAHAVLLASQLIQADVLDGALVVGYEFPIVPASVGGLDWVSALYRRDEPADRAYDDPAAASRPYSRDRRGFLLAEGAGAVFVARAGYARGRGWPVKAIVRGGYANSDADHLTRIDPDNIGRCMRTALERSAVDAGEIDCVNAHATSTPIGDRSELTALAGLFGDRLRRLPVVANKSQLGHSLGASAMLALIFAVRGMLEGALLPTLNHLPDPDLPPAFIPASATDHPHRVTLLNSFGFGGTNASLVVERGEG